MSERARENGQEREWGGREEEEEREEVEERERKTSSCVLLVEYLPTWSVREIE